MARGKKENSYVVIVVCIEALINDKRSEIYYYPMIVNSLLDDNKTPITKNLFDKEIKIVNSETKNGKSILTIDLADEKEIKKAEKLPNRMKQKIIKIINCHTNESAELEKAHNEAMLLIKNMNRFTNENSK